MSPNQSGINRILCTRWHYGKSNMAAPMQENSLAGNSLKKKIAESQSGLTNITFFGYTFTAIVYIMTSILCYVMILAKLTSKCAKNKKIIIKKLQHRDYLKINVLLVRSLWLLSLHICVVCVCVCVRSCVGVRACVCVCVCACKFKTHRDAENQKGKDQTEY